MSAPGILTCVPRLLAQPVETVKKLVAAAGRLAGSTTMTPVPAEPVAPPPAGAVQRSERVGRYDEPLTALVRRRPGVTVAQAAEALEVHPTALYPVIRRLEARGEVIKRGRELHPAARKARSVQPADGQLERLWCEEGHWWERPPTRGRKPRRCTEHR